MSGYKGRRDMYIWGYWVDVNSLGPMIDRENGAAEGAQNPKSSWPSQVRHPYGNEAERIGQTEVAEGLKIQNQAGPVRCDTPEASIPLMRPTSGYPEVIMRLIVVQHVQLLRKGARLNQTGVLGRGVAEAEGMKSVEMRIKSHSVAGSSPINGSELHFPSTGVGLDQGSVSAVDPEYTDRFAYVGLPGIDIPSLGVSTSVYPG
ncbi:hypothetical protein K438DRAFT_1777106 [Mycena galopus ATCC 62051]|nr:hypothetical protein K438DRAFT_1777106 [Mycena galopus ATCC 62051]